MFTPIQDIESSIFSKRQLKEIRNYKRTTRRGIDAGIYKASSSARSSPGPNPHTQPNDVAKDNLLNSLKRPSSGVLKQG
jgi:hypothetical protein